MNTGETILDFYKDRSVFITGATGFMGKILVEKILRSIPDIGRVYLLIRPSRGKDVHCRLQEELIDSKVRKFALRITTSAYVLSETKCILNLSVIVKLMNLFI